MVEESCGLPRWRGGVGGGGEGQESVPSSPEAGQSSLPEALCS